MTKRLMVLAAALLLLGVRASAQQVEQQVEQKAEPKAKEAPVPVPAGQPVNVKIELTIVDQMGPGQPTKQTVSLIVADRETGFIRSRAVVSPSADPRVPGNPPMPGRNLVLNVDARPVLIDQGRIRLDLGFEYQPKTEAQEQGGSPPSSSLNQRVGVILTPGQPLPISQAIDPATGRQTTVEIRATVLK